MINLFFLNTYLSSCTGNNVWKKKSVFYCIACIWKSMTHKRVKLTENWVSVIGRPFMLTGSGFTDLVTWILYPANTLESLAFSREEWRSNLYCLSAGSSLIKKGVWSADKRRKHTSEAEFSKGLNYVDLWHKLVSRVESISLF